MNKIFKILFLISLLALPASFNACGVVQFSGENYETIVGNPMNPTQASSEILFAICSVINRCSDVPIDNCMSGVSGTSGIGVRLGLPPNVDDPFSTLVNAENTGVISANLKAANTCVDTINNLLCSNQDVINAYNPSNSYPFAAVPYMVPMNSCDQVFNPSPVPYACPSIPIAGVTYTVNDLGDAPDASPGNKICATAIGTCTLRAALMEVNSDGSGTYNVVVPSGTIFMGSPLPITNSVNIVGSCSNPTIIDGGGSQQIMAIGANNVSLGLQSLTLQNGFMSAPTGGAAIGNIYYTGDIVNGQQLVFNNNIYTGDGGGAIDVNTFNCTDCVFNSNRANGGRGGAVFVSAGLNLNRTLFMNNIASTGGGAIDLQTTPPVTIVNSTFYNNTANSGNGAISIDYDTTLTLINDTFIYNTGKGGFSAGAVGGGAGTEITFENTLMFNNTATRGNCQAATINSKGGNLSNPSSTFCTLSQPTDLSSVPLMGPLQGNGGFTSTMALLPGSPGIDQALSSNCPSVDQRNFPRSIDGMCDIGAFEAQP